MPTILPLRGFSWKSGAILALRVAPWVVFGPITGFFTNRAVSAFLKGRPSMAVLMIILNIVIVASIPALTVAVTALGAGAYRQAQSPGGLGVSPEQGR